MKRSIYVALLLVILLTGCSFPQIHWFEKIIQHSEPDLQMDNTYFTQLGCFNDPTCLPDDLQNLDSPVESISEPDPILGGLTPSLPLAVATNMIFSADEDFPAVYSNRCMLQQNIRYLVSVDGDIRLVDSVEGLASIYAPIDSQEEALSFAAAATGLSAVYDLQSSSNIELYSRQVEETFVKTTTDGYVVHLFDTFLCGCGPHIVSSVDVTVTHEGILRLAEPVQEYHLTDMDGLCID